MNAHPDRMSLSRLDWIDPHPKIDTSTDVAVHMLNLNQEDRACLEFSGIRGHPYRSITAGGDFVGTGEPKRVRLGCTGALLESSSMLLLN